MPRRIRRRRHFATPTYPGLQTIGGFLNIQQNAVLTHLGGLTSLTSVGSYLQSYQNALLGNVNGLDSLTSVGGDLIFYNNDALASFNGLAALQSVGGDIAITYHDDLADIDDLIVGLGGALTTVGGALNFSYNPLLSRCAPLALDAALGAGQPGGLTNTGNQACVTCVPASSVCQ